MAKGDTQPAGSMNVSGPGDTAPADMPRNKQGPMVGQGDVAELANAVPATEPMKTVNGNSRVDY